MINVLGKFITYCLTHFIVGLAIMTIRSSKTFQVRDCFNVPDNYVRWHVLSLRGCEVLARVFKPLICERACGGKVEIVGAIYVRFPVWSIKTNKVWLILRLTQTVAFVANPNIGGIIAFSDFFPTETP